MPVDLEEQILQVLRAMKSTDRPATIGDLARRFGLGASLVAGSARHLVDRGLALPSMLTVRGVPTLHGLLPQPKAEPEPPAEPVVTDEVATTDEGASTADQ